MDGFAARHIHSWGVVNGALGLLENSQQRLIHGGIFALKVDALPSSPSAGRFGQEVQEHGACFRMREVNHAPFMKRVGATQGDGADLLLALGCS